MPRSLANGDYSLVMAIESASRANSWYRVLADRQSGNLSCDCPSWTFKQDGGTTRSCKHTSIAQTLVTTPQAQGLRPVLGNIRQQTTQILGVGPTQDIITRIQQGTV